VQSRIARGERIEIPPYDPRLSIDSFQKSLAQAN
jgi:hypothetical protein